MTDPKMTDPLRVEQLFPKQDLSVAVSPPPHSREAEEAVLGAVLINPEAYVDAVEFLRAEDFYIHRNRWIFAAIARLFQRQTPVDLLTLSEELERANQLGEIGGSAYLTSLINQVPSSLNAEAYARIVEAASVRRKMLAAANRIASLAYNGDLATVDALEKAALALEAVFTARKQDGGLTPFSLLLSQAYDRIDKSSRSTELPGIPTGLIDLDRKLGNLKRGSLYVVAGRPGQGKTSLKLTFARNAALREKRVAFFSLEMSDEQITNRILAQDTGFDVRLLDSGKIEEKDWDVLTAAIETREKLPLFVDDTPGITPQQIKTRCRRLEMLHGKLDLMVVDYLQLMNVGDNKIRVENRTQEVGYLTRTLKGIARELDVPIVVGAQLSRAVEQRADKRPQLSDLRESGDIEADADVVMFTHNDLAVDTPVIPTEIIVAKHRNGPTGSVHTQFKRNITRFDNLAVKEKE